MKHDPEWLAECRERAPAIAQRFADGMGQGHTVLSAPGCNKGCTRCTRECAARFISANLWASRHAAAEIAAAQATLSHGGRFYVAAEGRA